MPDKKALTNKPEIELKSQIWITSLIKTGIEHSVDVSEEEIVKECEEIRKKIHKEIYGKD